MGAAGSTPAPLGLLVNAAARRVKRRDLGREPFWRSLLPDPLVHITRSLDELDQAVAAFRDQGVRVVAALGGDGSLHHLVEALLRHHDEGDLPMVLALAGGTMNGLARALGTGGPPDRVLRAAVAVLAARTPPPVESRHVLRVRDEISGRTHHGFGFGTGLVFRAFQDYYRDPEPNLIDAIRASLLPVKAALFGGTFYDGARLDVQVDHEPWLSEPPHSLLASVVDNPLLWFRPFHSRLEGAAAFHLAATSMRSRELALRLWSVFRGRCRHPRLRVGVITEATVRGETGYLLDGDLYPSGGSVDVRLTVGPRLRFLVPKEPQSA